MVICQHVTDMPMVRPLEEHRKKSRESSDKEGRAFNTGDMSEEHRESQAYAFKDEMLKCTIYHQFLDGGSLFTFSTLLELNPSYT